MLGGTAVQTKIRNQSITKRCQIGGDVEFQGAGSLLQIRNILTGTHTTVGELLRIIMVDGQGVCRFLALQSIELHQHPNY